MRATLHERHEHQPGGAPFADRRGRLHPTCLACGSTANSPLHRTGPTMPRRPRARPAPVVSLACMPRELVMLAYACDAVAELPVAVAGWRVQLRAAELRDALGGIPRPERELWRAPVVELDPAEPVAVMAPTAFINGSVEGSRFDHRARQGELPVPRLVDTVEQSALARAKQQTRGIQDRRSRELALRAVVAGYQLRRGRGGHWILEHGTARLVIAGSTGDHRAWLNLRSQARRQGIDVEGLST